MRLPFAENAVIDIRKLTEYLLNPNHIDGKHKSALWRGAVGITNENAEELSSILLNAVMTHDAVKGKFDRYGERYTIDFLLEWRGKSAIIRSGWIIEHGSKVPRLTTAFPR